MRAGRIPIGLLAVLVPLAGCSVRNQVELRQPFAPPAQQVVELSSTSAYEMVRGDRRVCLATFPLPGAVSGPGDFVLYFNLPRAEGLLGIEPARDGSARGFLIQRRGDLSGITYAVGGSVRVDQPWYRRNTWRLELDVKCNDQTRILGKVYLRPNEPQILRFQRRHAPDIARLFDEASTGTPTPPRPFVALDDDAPVPLD